MTQVLLEKYLASQFKFGFELEAFADEAYSDFNEYDDDEIDDEIRHYIAKKIAQEFQLNAYNVEIKGDGSLSTPYELDYAFEWATPVMEFTPANLQKCINGLSRLVKARGIYTNDTCGFHVHLSFPNISDTDMIWIISQLSQDKEILEQLINFQGMEFYDDEYASLDFLDWIGDYIQAEKYPRIAREFSTEKYRAFHIHPQGTLEWRGPRNFLNHKDVNLIKDFFKLLHKFVMWISKAISATSLNGISKENFFKLVFGDQYKMGDTIITDFNARKNNNTKDKIAKIIQENRTTAFVKLIQKYIREKDKKVEKILSTFIDLLTGYHFSNSEKYLASVFDELYAQNSQEEIGFLLKRVYFEHAFSQILIHTNYPTFEMLLNSLKVAEPQRVIWALKSLMATYYNYEPFKTKMIKYLKENGDKFDFEDWKDLFNIKNIIKYHELITNPKMVNINHIQELIEDCLRVCAQSPRFNENPELFWSHDIYCVMALKFIESAKQNNVLLMITKDILKNIINKIHTENNGQLSGYYQTMCDEASKLLKKLYE